MARKKKEKQKIMNLPNKITLARIALSVIIIVILVLPFDMLGIKISPLYINEKLVVDIRYIIAGVLFIIASLTDFVDGKIARSRNLVTNFGKMIDAIADKVLVNSILIILAASGDIHPIVPVIVVFRDTVVDSIKMIAGSKGRVVAAIKSGKLKTACLMTGIALTLFYNMPFEFINLRVADGLLLIATILSLYSGIQYYIMNKELIFED
jgi:CDP-diacylglycerol--glycerol-3-phosphate 3-phosphatidyltransferase